MKYFDRHLEIALNLVQNYNQHEPFHLALKRHFKENKKFGSRDRKSISNLCYAWFRLGYRIEAGDEKNKLTLAFYTLFGDGIDFTENEIIQEFDLEPNFTELTTLERTSLLEEKGLIYPLENSSFFSLVSEKVNPKDWLIGMLEQPKVWLRPSRNDYSLFKDTLNSKHILFEEIEGAVGIEASGILNDKEFNSIKWEVQDLSSQRSVLELINNLRDDDKVWDCCCGAGGKSLAILDAKPNIRLYVSDQRSSIMRNLNQRMKVYDLSYFSSLVDLEEEVHSLSFRNKLGESFEVSDPFFDAIIADVPCSGSGTWSRSPENLSQNQPIDLYTEKQAKILKSASPFLKAGGTLYYITCSVFKRENEDQIEAFIAQNPEYKLEKMDYILGRNKRADTLFFASLRKT
jgi:16S rRNA (cytosine967-C5)-methyltransferase